MANPKNSMKPTYTTSRDLSKLRSFKVVLVFAFSLGMSSNVALSQTIRETGNDSRLATQSSSRSAKRTEATRGAAATPAVHIDVVELQPPSRPSSRTLPTASQSVPRQATSLSSSQRATRVQASLLSPYRQHWLRDPVSVASAVRDPSIEALFATEQEPPASQNPLQAPKPNSYPAKRPIGNRSQLTSRPSVDSRANASAVRTSRPPLLNAPYVVASPGAQSIGNRSLASAPVSQKRQVQGPGTTSSNSRMQPTLALVDPAYVQPVQQEALPAIDELRDNLFESDIAAEDDEPSSMEKLLDEATKEAEAKLDQTDRENADDGDSNNDANGARPEASSKNAEKSQLSVDAMLAPLPGATSLFSRVSQQSTYLHSAIPANGSTRVSNSTTLGPTVWSGSRITWVTPVFYHRPLYFEQPNLERYGQGAHPLVQPAVSAAHFFGTVALVPYKSLTHHPREKKYTLGHGRPGNCVPYRRGVILGESTLGEVFKYYEDCSGYR